MTLSHVDTRLESGPHSARLTDCAEHVFWAQSAEDSPALALLCSAAKENTQPARQPTSLPQNVNLGQILLAGVTCVSASLLHRVMRQRQALHLKEGQAAGWQGSAGLRPVCGTRKGHGDGRLLGLTSAICLRGFKQGASARRSYRCWASGCVPTA